MKKIFILFVIIYYNQFSYGDIELQVGGIAFGYTEIEMSGSNTITGDSVTIRPDNKISYTASIGLIFKWLRPLSIKVGAGYLSYRTQKNTTALAVDNSSYEADMIDARLITQFTMTNELSLRFGVTYPFKTELRGPLNNTAGGETAQLKGEVGFLASLGYHYNQYFQMRVGYIHNSAIDSEAETNLGVKANFNHFVVELGAGF